VSVIFFCVLELTVEAVVLAEQVGRFEDEGTCEAA